MSGEWDGLRAAAEAATPGGWVTSGPDLCLIAPNEVSSWGLAYVTRSPADATYIAAVSPDVVLGLLDRLQAAEAAVERVQLVAFEWDDLAAFMVGVGNRPGDDLQARDLAELVRRANEVFAALDGKPSTVRDRWALTPPPADSPQPHVTAPLSASGAESDHGGRRDGEGLA